MKESDIFKTINKNVLKRNKFNEFKFDTLNIIKNNTLSLENIIFITLTQRLAIKVISKFTRLYVIYLYKLNLAIYERKNQNIDRYKRNKMPL